MHISRTLVAIVLVLIVVLSLSTALLLGNERAGDQVDDQAGDNEEALGCIFDDMGKADECLASNNEERGGDPVPV